jgi:acid phosphatase type 7
MTAPLSSATTLSFYGYGDTRPEFLNLPVEHNAVLSALLSDMNQDPDQRQTLLVHIGDYVYNGLNEFMWDLHQFNPDPQFNAIYAAFANLPFMGVLGNHEAYDAYTVKQVTFNYQNIGELFRKYYPYRYPNKKHFNYSFDYGPIHFVIIDTWTYQGVPAQEQTIDKEQEDWLRRDLRASQKPWKIAMLHTPIWQCLEGIPTMQAQLTPILKDGGVHLVLQGHQHYYSHAETEGPYAGMTYLTLGGGGADLIAEKSCVAEANKTWPPKAVFEKYFFARFDISGDSMTVTVKATDGTVIETFQITN